MTRCAGCSKLFPKLDVDECAKCLKRLLSPNDESIKVGCLLDIDSLVMLTIHPNNTRTSLSVKYVGVSFGS